MEYFIKLGKTYLTFDQIRATPIFSKNFLSRIINATLEKQKYPQELTKELYYF